MQTNITAMPTSIKHRRRSKQTIDNTNNNNTNNDTNNSNNNVNISNTHYTEPLHVHSAGEIESDNDSNIHDNNPQLPSLNGRTYSEPSPGYYSQQQQQQRSRHNYKYSISKLRDSFVDSLRNTALEDITYEQPVATCETTSYDIEPAKTLRSNPLWRLLAVLCIIISVSITAHRTIDYHDGSISFGVNLSVDDITDSIHNAKDSLYERLEALVNYPTRPGILAKQDGLIAHNPVVFIPGIISTSLEVWQADECAKTTFRQRLYGGSLMIKSLILDSECWIKHMMLDNITGLDPPNIKLRASSGLEAADYLVGTYWVWAKLIENFADIGYDTSNMYLAAYDWRLAFKDLQIRDYYFVRLQKMIELAKYSNHNRKVALIAHSM